VQEITIKDVEQIAFALAQELLAFDEPIPDYSTRFPGILESCLAVPFQWFGGKSLYRGLVSKSSILFYLMVKNHPFQNGNKRIAISTLLVFLILNKKWLRVHIQDFYDFANRVASSPPEDRDLIVLEIKGFIKQHLKVVKFNI
jgi:prophage maintenance system killer protein